MDFIINYWLEFAMGIIAAAVTIGFKLIFSKIKKWKIEQDAVKDGVLALLHDRLYQGCQLHLQMGKISESELRNMECLYNGYHELGGNGTGTELYERVKELPLKIE